MILSMQFTKFFWHQRRVLKRLAVELRNRAGGHRLAELLSAHRYERNLFSAKLDPQSTTQST